jgi:hypothetical protein
MSYDGYVRFCRELKETDKLHDLMANHTYNINRSTDGRGTEAWERMRRIVRAEILRRAEKG